MAVTGETSPPPDPKAYSPSGNGNRHEQDENPAAAAFHHIPQYIAELRAYFRYFLSAKADAAKAKLRRIAVFAALGVIGLIAASAVVVTAVFLLLWGLAHAIGRLLWQQYWAGDLIVGVFVLGGIGLGVWMGIRRLTKASRRRTEKKYEHQRTRQRVQLGHDVQERAAGH